MTFNLSIPAPQQPVSDNTGKMTVPWYRYLQNLNSANGSNITLPAQSLFGNSSTGEESAGPISIGSGLILSNGTLSSSVSGGTVTSVGLGMPNLFSVTNSPVTTSGTIGVSLLPQVENTVFAGPSSGSTSEPPTFRSLVVADIPPLPYVTSIGIAAPSQFNVTGSPVTSSGTITLAWVNQNAALVFAGPATGVAAAPTFRTLQDTDLPSQAASTLLGNPASSAGTPTAITIGTGLALSTGGVLSATGGGSGTVTSVALTMPSIFNVAGSPITTSGTFAVTLSTESANSVWAGPTSGTSATPTFRALVAGDIPALSYVTSVGLSAPSLFNVTGSPVTSSGTLTFSLATQNANLVFAGPSSGAAAAPAFRALVAADLPISAIPGRLVGIQRFATHGTSTYTPTSGTNQIIVDFQASGAAGGSSSTCTSSQVSAGGGGGSGGFARVWFTSGFSGGLTVTIGQGGAAASAGGNAGGSGGTTSFGSLISAAGATGGNGATPVTWSSANGTAGMASGGAGGPAPTVTGGTTLLSVAGTQGWSSAAASPNGVIGGLGAGSILGSITPMFFGGTLRPAVGPGSGSSGSASTNSQAGIASDPGNDGLIIVYEFS